MKGERKGEEAWGVCWLTRTWIRPCFPGGIRQATPITSGAFLLTEVIYNPHPPRQRGGSREGYPLEREAALSKEVRLAVFMPGGGQVPTSSSLLELPDAWEADRGLGHPPGTRGGLCRVATLQRETYEESGGPTRPDAAAVSAANAHP